NKPGVYAPLIPPVTTDAEGRFSLRGIGRERVAEVYVDGVPDQASALIVVANRTLEKPILINDETVRTKKIQVATDADLAIFGNQFELSLKPGRTIRGVVTDRVTGLPVSGMRVVGPTISRLEYPGFDRFFATTDKQGRYRIEGFPVMKGARFKIEVAKQYGRQSTVEPASDLHPYFGRELTLNIKPGTGPANFNFPLSKGVWITGKVVDGATGAGIGGEAVEYYAFNENPFLQRDLKDKIRPRFDNNLRTNEDGTFKVRAYPGRGIVIAGGGHDYLEGIGADKIAGLKPDEIYNTIYGLNGSSPYIRNTTIEVNVPEDAQTHAVELRLIKGKSREVTVVDAEGNSVEGLEASGLDNQIENPISKVENSALSVTNLFPGEQREVVARCVSRKLMGMAVVSEKDNGPVTLKLEPWANVTGRLVDDAGQPRSNGLRIVLEDGKLPIHTLNGMDYDKQEFLIDPDGKFHIDGLVPGAKYQLQVVEGGFRYVGDVTEDLTLKPGETRELGNVKVMQSKDP
ncbi:MAG: antirepressor regulating drug resistance protein, partial [Planctomycetaceae bacterium]|nr:antirepressor regulating drug resistance protein [Planctomycetaceae bacterium]